MPNYELKCRNCGGEFEEFMSFSEKEKASCPACGCKELQQNYSSHIFLKKKPACPPSSCASCRQKCSR